MNPLTLEFISENSLQWSNLIFVYFLPKCANFELNLRRWWVSKGLTSTLRMTLTFQYRNSLLRKHFSIEFRAEKAHWNSLRKRIKALWLAGRNRYFTFTFPHRVQISSPQGQNRTHFHSLTSLLLIWISYHCKPARDRSNSTQRGGAKSVTQPSARSQMYGWCHGPKGKNLNH